MKPIGEIFLIDDEEEILHACNQTFELEGYTIRTFTRAEDVLPLLHEDWMGAVITDVKMPGMDGMELFGAIKKIAKDIPVIILTGHGDVPMAMEAMHGGAFDFIEKPTPPDQLLEVAAKALETRRKTLEKLLVAKRLTAGSDIASRILGESPKIRELRSVLGSLAVIDVDVLLIGETGAGKELAARCLHDLGHRSSGRFVEVNCGAIPENLVESELFGHEKGAFTSASNKRIGKIELADGGTLFLDEIESMTLDVQVRLLRALQERKIERVGGSRHIPVDFRVVAASKIDLRDAVANGTFREDLFYRLNVARIPIPSLKKRREDIPLILNYFLSRMSDRFDRPEPVVPEELMERLSAYHWPGNVRELRNVAQQLVLGLDIDLADCSRDSNALDFELGFDELVQRYEKRVIIEALERCNGRIERTARLLKIPRKRLYLRMQKLDISRE